MNEARALHDITRLAAEADVLADFAAQATERVRELLELDECCLWLPSHDGQRLVQAGCAGSQMARGPLALHQPCAETTAYHTLSATFTDNPDFAGPQQRCARSSHAIFPLRGAEGALGVLVFAMGEGRAFSASDDEALSEIADQVALGIALVRLREERARRVELQAVFDGMAKRLLLTTTTPQDVLRDASSYLRTYLGAQASMAAVPEGQWWRVIAAHGYPDGLVGRRYHQTVLFGLSSAARNRAPLLTDDAAQVSSAVSANGRLASAVIVPLVTPAGVAAVLSCGFEERREFMPWDMEVALRVSETISLGFQNAVLRADEQMALHLADRMRSIQARLFAATDDETAMDTALAQAATLVDAAACGYVVEGPDGWRFEHTADERGMFEFDEVRSEVHELLGIWTERAGTRAYTSPTPGLVDDMWIAVAPVPNATPRAAVVAIRRDGRFSVPHVNFLQNLARSISLAELDRRVRADREWLAASRQQWLAGVSHDLRTPLASIRGYAELLAEPVPVPPEEVQRQARIMAEQTWRIQTLVEDMLLTFRIKEGALPVSLEPADLFAVATLVAEETRADFRISDPQRLRVEGTPGVHFSRVDPHLLERAVRNLVSNAIVHNPQGTRVTIRVTNSGDAEQIVVSDTGSGMDAEQLARLWNRYERGEGTPNASGIGLGMSVSRQLIEAMGGSIGIASHVGCGTTVTIGFPPVSSAIAV